MTSRERKSRGPSHAIDPARRRWVRTDSIEFVHYDVPEGERDKGEGALPGWGNTHMLSVIYKRGRGGHYAVELTEMTVEELDAVKEFYEKVFAEAREVCELRDKKAQEAFENGDDTVYRLYRQVPRVIER